MLFDFSAAFDTIDHQTLLGYLKSWLGLSGTVLKWFVSYLSYRCQAINIGLTRSELSKLNGVPQGSLLGQCCSHFYNSSKQNYQPSYWYKIQLYADDSMQKHNTSVDLIKLNTCFQDVQ